MMMIMMMTMNLNKEELGLSSEGGAPVGCERLPNLHHCYDDDLEFDGDDRDDEDDCDEDDALGDHNDDNNLCCLVCRVGSVIAVENALVAMTVAQCIKIQHSTMHFNFSIIMMTTSAQRQQS